jgi:transglutaminase-like putative cysteine protease
MSAVAAPPARHAPAPAPSRAPDEAGARDSLPLRLAAFAALALFGALHWITLVVHPPGGKAFVAVVLATACGGTLAALARARVRTPLALAVPLAALTTLAALVLGLMAMGVPGRQLLPAHLGDFFDGIDRGLVGVSHVDWPYDGPDPWVRLTLLLAVPAVVTLAAALAFWPARAATGARRGAALVLLLVLYAVPATEHETGEPLVKGFLLLVLVAAWLWLPRLSARQALPALAVVGGVGLLAMPLAARLDSGQPWWDYTSWTPFGGGKDISFDWNHAYGPLDWPRSGTTLLNVRSREPHYWKTETLDRFDGFRWLHSSENDQTSPMAELPASPGVRGRRWDYYRFNPRWDTRVRVTIRSLRSDFLVGAGTTYAVAGAGLTSASSDGTTVRLAEPLEDGDSYTFRAYVPDPSASQMRGAPASYPSTFEQYTALALPGRGETAFGDGGRGDASRSAQPPPRVIQMPFLGSVISGARERRRLLASPYAEMYRLAQRIRAGSTSEYDVVQRIQRYLRTTFTYDEKVPRHAYPLAAFLSKDRRGYCQQFSGAMALMLRMVGVPARVAAGFSPGSHNPYSGEYRVRDLDAHSWVEAYFPGIGWVTFDPTPAAAPAQRQLGTNQPAASGDQAGSITQRDRLSPLAPTGKTPAPATHEDGGLGFWPIAGLVLLGLCAAGATALALLGRRRRRAPVERLAEAQLREVERALRRLGWRVPGGSTLMALEARLARAAGPAPAGYLARLRAHRYARTADGLPDGRDRRAFRRALTAGKGLRARLLGLTAIPPGGPRLR